jgi:hypothetical protein
LLGFRRETAFYDGPTVVKFRATVGMDKIEVWYIFPAFIILLFELITNKLTQIRNILNFLRRKRTPPNFLLIFHIYFQNFLIIFQFFDILRQMITKCEFINNNFNIKTIISKLFNFVIVLGEEQILEILIYVAKFLLLVDLGKGDCCWMGGICYEDKYRLVTR